MKIAWKREFKGKKHSFEVEYLLNYKINGERVSMPRIYLEKDYLQDDLKSVVEEYVIDKHNKREEIVKQNASLDEKTRVRNHFRNVCFRKKFNTLTEHVKYIAKYYDLPEMSVYDYVLEDLPFIKKETGIN
jgi:hypothetical protein